MARVQAPRDAENFGFTPPASERMQKVLRSFRMHLRSRFTPPVVDAPPAAAPSGPVALDVLNSGPR